MILLKSVFLIAIVAVAMIGVMVPNTWAAIDPPKLILDIKNEKLTVVGEVTNILPGNVPITFVAITPDGNIIAIDQSDVENDGNYSILWFINNWKSSGTYTIRVGYGDDYSESTIFINPGAIFSPEPVKNSEMEIIGLSSRYIPSESIEVKVKVTDSSFNCGDLYITIYNYETTNVVTQGTFFEQCFSSESNLLPIDDKFSKVINTPGSYDLVADMISKDLSNISASGTFTVMNIASFVDQSKDSQHYIDRYNNEPTYKEWFDENYPQYISIYQAVGLEDPISEHVISEHVISESIIHFFDISSRVVEIDKKNNQIYFVPLEPYNEIIIIDSFTYEIIDQLKISGNYISDIDLNPSTERIFVSYESEPDNGANGDSFIQMYNINTFEPEMQPLKFETYGDHIKTNESGNRLYHLGSATNTNIATLSVFEVSKNNLIFLDKFVTDGSSQSEILINEEMGLIFVSGQMTNIFDLNDYSQLKSINRGTLGQIAIDVELNQFYGAPPNGNTIKIIDLDTKNILETIDVNGFISDISVNPKNHRVYVSTSLGFEIIDGNTKKNMGKFYVDPQNMGSGGNMEIDSNLQKAYVAHSKSSFVVDLECNCPEFFENYVNNIEKQKQIQKEAQNKIQQFKQNFDQQAFLIFSQIPAQSELLDMVGIEKKNKYQNLFLDLESRNISYSNFGELLNSNEITYSERQLILAFFEDALFIFKTLLADKVTEFDDLLTSTEIEINKSDLPDLEKEQLIKEIRFDAGTKKNQMLSIFAEIVQPLENTLNREKSKQNIMTEISDNSSGGCLIATATYGSEMSPQVQQLRELRDNQLLQTESGTAFMGAFNDIYYSFSPIVADYERENPLFKEIVKIAITPMISSLSLMENAETESEVLGLGISLIILNLGMYLGIPAVVIVGIKKIR